MSTQERASENLPIQIRPLGGVDESQSLIDIAPNRFNSLFGVYPSAQGGLQRLPGKTIWQSLGEPIYRIVDLQNSKRHILVETATRILLFTIEELLGISYGPTTNTPNPFLMRKAIVTYHAAAGTNDVTVIGTSATIRQLNLIALNEINPNTGLAIVTSVAANIITLPAGSYKFSFRTTANGSSANSTANAFVSFLYNNTATANLYSGNNVVSSPAYFKSDGANVSPNVVNHFSGGVVTLAGATDIYLKTIAKVTASTVIGGVAANVGTDEIYSVVEIEPVF